MIVTGSIVTIRKTGLYGEVTYIDRDRRGAIPTDWYLVRVYDSKPNERAEEWLRASEVTEDLPLSRVSRNARRTQRQGYGNDPGIQQQKWSVVYLSGSQFRRSNGLGGLMKIRNAGQYLRRYQERGRHQAPRTRATDIPTFNQIMRGAPVPIDGGKPHHEDRYVTLSELFKEKQQPVTETLEIGNDDD